MNKEEIEEIETLEIDFKDTDDLELALEVSSKKAIYLIDDLIKYLIELQQENKKYKKVIDKAIVYIENCLKQTPIENRTKNDDILDFEYEYILGILKEVL